MNDDVYHTLRTAFCQADQEKKAGVSEMSQAGTAAGAQKAGTERLRLIKLFGSGRVHSPLFWLECL
ncbi:MAG: hypothetical protein ACI4MP_13715 [Candidatus Ventricola sp.]